MFPNRTLYKCLTLISPLQAQLGTRQGYSPEADGQCEGLKINRGDRNRNLLIGAQQQQRKTTSYCRTKKEKKRERERKLPLTKQ